MSSSRPPVLSSRPIFACGFPGCGKRFPTKHFLKRHKRCHMKTRPASPAPSQGSNVLLIHSSRACSISFDYEVVPPTPPSIATNEDNNAIPSELRLFGITENWLLNPTPLSTAPLGLTVNHLQKLVQLKNSFDFTWPRLGKWLRALGVEPAQALASIVHLVSDKRSGFDQNSFAATPLLPGLNDAPRNALTVKPETVIEDPTPRLVSLSDELLTIPEVTLEGPVDNASISGDEATPATSDIDDDSPVPLDPTAPDSATPDSGRETVWDIPLPTERVCNTDPETLSQIALPQPIPLHDIPLPSLSTIPLPAD